MSAFVRANVRVVAVLAVAIAAERAAFAAEPVQSGEVVNVFLDQAKLMRVPDGTTTLVVGNPLIADVAIQTGGTMVVTGKGYGTTNLLALKVTLTARTVADLVSQVSSIDNSGMTNSLNAGTKVMAPFPSANLKVVVSSIKIDAQGNATVEWSDTYNGAARAKGSTVTLPEALKVPSSYLIWSEVEYDYTPVIGYVVTGSLTLKDQIYMRPRLSDFVSRIPS